MDGISLDCLIINYGTSLSLHIVPVHEDDKRSRKVFEILLKKSIRHIYWKCQNKT